MSLDRLSRKKVEPLFDKDNDPPNTEPDWTKSCENCGATPIVPCSGLCGPCHFGEADTMLGNW